MKEKEFIRWIGHIKKYRLPILKNMSSELIFSGVGIELGAGTCWFCSVISQKENVDKIYAIDTNQDRIKLAKEKFIPYFQGREDKIELLNQDFENVSFELQSIDFIICDASLHHAINLDRLLKNMRKFLKPEGFLLAIREPVLPKLEPLRVYRRWNFGRKQKRQGDIENIYSKEEWESYFKNAGFCLNFVEYKSYSTIKERMLSKISLFNGILFSRYYLIGK